MMLFSKFFQKRFSAKEWDGEGRSERSALLSLSRDCSSLSPSFSASIQTAFFSLLFTASNRGITVGVLLFLSYSCSWGSYLATSRKNGELFLGERGRKRGQVTSYREQ